MIVKDFPLDPRERRASRLQLGQNIDAVSATFDHPGDPAHLPFDPAQPRQLPVMIGVLAMRG